MTIEHDHRTPGVSRAARVPRIRGALGAMALVSFGCSASVPERSQLGIRTAPLLFVTGQSGTQTVTLRAADADGTTRTLAEVELDVPPPVPIAGFDYDQTGDFFQWSNSGLRVSPDGLSVLFLHDGSAEILDVANGTPAVFSPLTHVAGWPAWSPDGSRVAYQVLSGDQLLTADLATGKVSIAVDYAGACLGAFEWSPDGTHLAYLLQRNCQGPSEFHVVTATGTGDRLVHPDATFCQGALRHPASVWSADSAHVVFVVSSIGTVTFQTFDLQGWGSATALVLPASDYEPSPVDDGSVAPHAQLTLPTVCEWSPRTNWLAVSGRSLHVLRPDGSEPRELDSAVFPPGSLADPFLSLSWAPDGEHLARISPDGGSFSLRTFRPSTDNADNGELSARLAYDGSPCCVSLEWAPDGKHALYLLPHDPTPEDSSTGSVRLWNAEDGTDEQLGLGQSVSGFNAEGTRVFYGGGGSSDATPRSRPVDGGLASTLPPDTRGWVSEGVVAVVHGGGIFISNVEGTNERPIWLNTPDEPLLSVRVPRPLTGE